MIYSIRTIQSSNRLGRKLRFEHLEQRQLLAVMEPDSDFFVLGTTLTALAAEVDEFLQSEGSLQNFTTDLPVVVANGSVIVDAVTSTNTAALQQGLIGLGAEITGTYGRMVSAFFPLQNIRALPTVSGIHFAQASLPITLAGATNTQGDIAMGTDLLRAAPFNLDGTGVTVGVISDSFGADPVGVATDIASGDLPGVGNPFGRNTPVNVLQESAVGGIDEGRAMLQIVHDVAPAANLAFATANGGMGAFAQNIENLAAAGVQIIVDDVCYVQEPYFQDGVIAQAVDAAVTAGTSYFTAAGNFARNSYDSTFRAGTALAAGAFPTSPAAFPPLITFQGGIAHDFDPSANVDMFQSFTLAAGQFALIGLQWDQPFFSVPGGIGSQNDIDIYILNAANEIVGGSFNANIGADPNELAIAFNPAGIAQTYSILIVGFSGPLPNRIKWIDFSKNPTLAGLEFNTNSPTSFGHLNVNLGNSVGAAAYFATPAFGSAPPQLETFSSAGGIPILFTPGGDRIPPVVRRVPNIVAPDNVNTTFFGSDIDGDGFPNFAGTSAASPHAAAFSALLLQLNPALTPVQIKDVLQRTAIDMNDPFTPGFDPGFDFGSGFGLINASRAVADVIGPDRGPQVTDVDVTGFPSFNLFNVESTEGPTPLVNSLTISVIDPPNRLPGFLTLALDVPVANAIGNYRIIGDHVGVVQIASVLVSNAPPVAGMPATATIELRFPRPLLDDRYTLTVVDDLRDLAGNLLDGESNASAPGVGLPTPSGNGVPGGDFVARFTVDSRPEIGSFVSQAINLDINGNFAWDPANAQIGNDATNADLSFTLPAFEYGGPIAGNLSPHELLVAGKFRPLNGQNGNGGNGAGRPRYFDQLATYGNYNGVFRWLIDFDSDGVVYGTGDPDGTNDLIVNQSTLPNFSSTAVAAATPIAGNFDGNAANGDEIGLYFSGLWAIDTDHNYVLDRVVSSNLSGHPIVGDFDGNGSDDLAVFNGNQFYFDLSFDPLVDTAATSQTTITWGFPGVLDRPVAADMDQDGIDDIGLWVPRNSANPPRGVAEWYFLVSNTFNLQQQIRNYNTVNLLNHGFSPVPFGADLYAEFGDERSLPIVGNFAPPVAPVEPGGGADLPGDYDRNGTVDMADFLVWRAAFGSESTHAADGNRDGRVDTADYIVWRNNLGRTAGTAASSFAMSDRAPSDGVPATDDASVASEPQAILRRLAAVDCFFTGLGGSRATRPEYVAQRTKAVALVDDLLLTSIVTRTHLRATEVAVQFNRIDAHLDGLLDSATAQLEDLIDLLARL